jgi:GNAT superfamily N-acetyltransferase
MSCFRSQSAFEVRRKQGRIRRNMKIREGCHDDARFIAQLLNQLDYPKDPESVTHRLDKLLNGRDDDLIVAESDSGEVLGFASIHYIPQIALDGDFVRISYFCVASDARSKGIGRSIEEEVSRRARLRGCDRIEVHCHSRRLEANRFYIRQGYTDSPQYLVKHIASVE